MFGQAEELQVHLDLVIENIVISVKEHNLLTIDEVSYDGDLRNNGLSFSN